MKHMFMEARCQKCRETFNPTSEEPEDLIHGVREDGEECGGEGVVLGSWFYAPAPHPYDDGRRLLAGHLDQIHNRLASMLHVWTVYDMPPDVLSEKEYPFHKSLEDMMAEVNEAAYRIRNPHEED